MALSVWNLARWSASRSPAVLTLAGLVGLGFWGHHNDWQLSLGSPSGGQPSSEEKSAEPAVKVVAPSPESGSDDPSRAVPTRIEFPSAEAVTKAGIRHAPAEVRTLAQYVTAYGMVDYEPSRYAKLAARTGGTVWQVYKEIGDPVRKGEVLALIDSAEVGKVKADFLQSLTQVQSRTRTLAQLRGLDKQGAIPPRSLQEAETALREARIRHFSDQQALLNLGLPARAEALEDLPEKELVRRLRVLGLPEAVLKGLDTETLTANLLPLTAPFDGQVVDRSAAVGEVIQMTQPKNLFVVADVRVVHIDLDVNPEDMPGVRRGQPVSFRADGGTVEAAGAVSHISPEVDEKTRRVRVHAETPNPEGVLRPNAFGTGHILVGERPGAVVVPGEAVQSDGNDSLVFARVSDTVFEARKVQTGLRQGNLVEVKGVRPGEEVVTHGSFVLKSELQKDRIGGGED